MSTCLFGNTFGHMFYLKESKKGRCRNFNEKTRKHEKRTGKFEKEPTGNQNTKNTVTQVRKLSA